MVAARGCYHGKCNFCAIPYGWDPSGYAGNRSAEKVFQDMLTQLDRHNLARFKFVDESFPPQIANTLADLILQHGLMVEWEAYVRLETKWTNKAFIKKLAKAGFRKAYFGLELRTGDKRHLLGKEDSADPDEILSIFNEYGIKVHFFCMYGFPGTGRREAEETTLYVLDNADRLDTVDVAGWVYEKHTIVHGVKIIIDPKKDWALRYRYAPLTREGLSSEDVEYLTDEMRDLVWERKPQLLHPVYRLVSPWK